MNEEGRKEDRKKVREEGRQEGGKGEKYQEEINNEEEKDGEIVDDKR